MFDRKHPQPGQFLDSKTTHPKVPTSKLPLKQKTAPEPAAGKYSNFFHPGWIPKKHVILIYFGRFEFVDSETSYSKRKVQVNHLDPKVQTQKSLGWKVFPWLLGSLLGQFLGFSWGTYQHRLGRCIFFGACWQDVFFFKEICFFFCGGGVEFFVFSVRDKDSWWVNQDFWRTGCTENYNMKP